MHVSITNEQIAAQGHEAAIDCSDIPDVADNSAQENGERMPASTTRNLFDAACSCEQYVRDRPFRSLLIAVGAGLLVGRFRNRS